MPKVTARQVFEYSGKVYTPGDVLQVEDRFVRVLVAVGRIYPPGAEPAPSAAGEYLTRDLAIERPPKARRNRIPVVHPHRAGRTAGTKA